MRRNSASAAGCPAIGTDWRSRAAKFLRFPQRCDVAQIYADGALAADNFYNGEPWRVPASLLYGRQCYLVMTPPSDAVFMDP